jgi:hypothetical protein
LSSGLPRALDAAGRRYVEVALADGALTVPDLRDGQRVRWHGPGKYHPKPRYWYRSPRTLFQGVFRPPPMMLPPLRRQRRRPTSCYATCCSRSPMMPSSPRFLSRLPNDLKRYLDGCRKIAAISERRTMKSRASAAGRIFPVP